MAANSRRRSAAPQDEREDDGVDANPVRGEHELPLGAKTYLLRPSYAAISAIESKTGRALPELVGMGNSGAMPLSVAGIVGAALIRAGAGDKDAMTRGVSAERIAEMIFEQGLPGAIARLTLCLLDAATGGRTASGEAKAPDRSPGQAATEMTEDAASAA